jgi:hypothetical protein
MPSILDNKNTAAPSVCRPTALLREARLLLLARSFLARYAAQRSLK